MSLLTDELRAQVGREVVYTAPEPVSRASIRYYAAAIGDENPLYVDDEAARAQGLPGVIAPPTMICDTNQYSGRAMDEDGFAGHLWDLEVPGTALIRGGNEYELAQPVRPDDVITATWTLTDLSERQTREGAPMLIVTSTARYENQRGEHLATNVETIIYLGSAR